MKTYVIDASVVLGFLLEENHALAQRFIHLLRSAQKHTINLLSSPLLALEVANGLRFTLKVSEDAEEVMLRFLALPIEILPLTTPQELKALSISYQYNTTVYDASYHVLALARSVTYLTADRTYYKKTKQLGNIQCL